MCNLYKILKSPAEIGRLFGAVPSSLDDLPSTIYPRRSAPVVRIEAGERVIDCMIWGFRRLVPGKTKMLTKHVTNARNLASPFWKSAVGTPGRRCLVPFTAFAEPKPGKDADGRPAQHWFQVNDQQLPAFAGLWRPGDGNALFAFATCEPNSLVAPLHEKAMPVILLPEDHETWLHGSVDEALRLQAPYPSQLMSVQWGAK